MEDYIVRATAAEGAVRAFAARTTNMVAEAQRLHGLSAVASAALGRTMTAAAMLGIDMKNEDNVLSMVIKGGGPLGNVVVVATSEGRIKAYVDNPEVELPLNAWGKLDVGSAVGNDGKITVIKDLGLKEPYVGQVSLVSGEIGDDVTNYLLVSEQQPSAVAVGVLVDKDYSVKAAGGYIVQVMPGASDDIIESIEKKMLDIPPVSTQIENGASPEDMLNNLLGEYNVKINAKIKPYFLCDCNRHRLESVLLSIGKAELEDIIKTDKKAELVCHYCNKKYLFNLDDLENLLRHGLKTDTHLE